MGLFQAWSRPVGQMYLCLPGLRVMVIVGTVRFKLVKIQYNPTLDSDEGYQHPLKIKNN